MSPKDNLIPLKSRSTAEQRRIRSMGGLANKNNPNAKVAATLREWEKKLQANGEMNEREKSIVVNMMHDGTMARFQLMQFYAKLLLKAKTDAGQVSILRDMQGWAEHQHGKAAVKNENVNVNFDVFEEEYTRYRRAVLNILQKAEKDYLVLINSEFERLKAGGT